MTPLSDAERQRWEDLDVARLLFGLSAEERAEFEALAARVSDEPVAGFEQVVAALDLAHAESEPTPLPAHLRRAILSGAGNRPSEHVAERSAERSPGVERAQTGAAHRNEDGLRYVPWLVAAACLVLALFVSWPRTSPPVDVAQLRSDLVRTAPDLIQIDWSPGTTPIQDATGDIVWSASRQQGFMRFRGMSVNAPSKEQYQLWIFDKNQSEKTPIDGGVFDIASDGEVIVPITPKLRVREAYLFAVTVEQPGGVVVSSREKLPLLAKVE